MSEPHRLYHTLLKQMVDMDRRTFLPPREERMHLWELYLDSDDDEPTNIIDIDESRL